jgi:predicted GIY-YIG superfamily endonuclease
MQLPHRLYVIDPAGGVELADLEHGEFTALYTDRPGDADAIIEEFKSKMNTRLVKMKQSGSRKHIPTEEEPNHYLIIDELLLCKRQIKDGAAGALGDVLAVGRKAGFIVIGCTQLGQKTTLGDLRDMFPQRICFGTRSQEMTDAILGTGASRSGAPAYELTEPGSGYFFTTEHRKYFKFQGEFIKDTLAIANPIPDKDTRPTQIDSRSVSPQASPITREPNVEKDGRTALYRLYGESGTLMYVGIARNPNKRFKQHANDKEWFKDVDHEKTKIVWYRSRDEAAEHEAQAIEDEMPIFNIIGSDTAAT